MIIFFLFRPDHDLPPSTALFRFFRSGCVTLPDQGFLHKHNPGCFPQTRARLFLFAMFSLTIDRSKFGGK
jgi:hypothetical protein